MEALIEEYEPKVSKTRTEASDEEAEYTMRSSERLQRRRRRCVYKLRVFMTMTESSTEYDGHAELATMTEALSEDK